MRTALALHVTHADPVSSEGSNLCKDVEREMQVNHKDWPWRWLGAACPPRPRPQGTRASRRARTCALQRENEGWGGGTTFALTACAAASARAWRWSRGRWRPFRAPPCHGANTGEQEDHTTRSETPALRARRANRSRWPTRRNDGAARHVMAALSCCITSGSRISMAYWRRVRLR